MHARIISLGEIISPNIMLTIQAFTKLVASKKTSSNPADIGKAIGGVLHASMNLINDFKLGNVNETDFNAAIISAIQKSTDVTLTTDEFDSAWNAMNPVFSQFSSLLNEAISYNSQPKHKLIFISATNPKDMRHLVSQLEANHIPYKIENDQLTEISGIKLLTTYTQQKSKAELVELAIRELKPVQSHLAASMSAILNSEPQTGDIKYVRSANNINDPVLKADTDKTNQEIEHQANVLLVDTLIWKKFEQQSLTDVLNNPQIVSRQLTAAML